MAHVISRNTFGKTIFEIYNRVSETDPDKNLQIIEGILKEFGFTIDIVADPFGRIILIDDLTKAEIASDN